MTKLRFTKFDLVLSTSTFVGCVVEYVVYRGSVQAATHIHFYVTPTITFFALRSVLVLGLRRFPLTTSILLSASGIWVIHPPDWYGGMFGNIGLVPLMYGVAIVVAERGIAVGAIATAAFAAIWIPGLLPQFGPLGPAPALFLLIFAGAPFAAGNTERLIDSTRDALTRRNRALIEAAKRARGSAAEEERQRLSQELQGIVKRSLSTMVEEASRAATHIDGADFSQKAAGMIEEIEQQGREALAETRRALHVLRTDDEAPKQPASVSSPARLPARMGRPDESVRVRSRFGPAEISASVLLGIFVMSEVWASTQAVHTTGASGRGYRFAAILRDPADVIGHSILLAGILLRRRLPLTSGIVMAAGLASVGLWGHYFGLAPFMISIFAIYSVWAYGGVRKGLIATAAFALAWIPAQHEISNFGYPRGLVYFVIMPIACALGNRRHRLETQIIELDTKGDQLAELGRAEVERARTEERLRIARELHDVTAHSLSVMTIQAGAARTILGSRPQRALEALSAVEQAGTAAIAQLDHVFNVIGTDGISAEDGLPGVSSIPALIADAKKAGVDVEWEMTAVPDDLPAGLDISLYRLTQEAVTNIIKHASPCRARVRLLFNHDGIELEVSNDPGTKKRDAAGRGHGLIGMRERAAMFGGEMTAQPRPDGGFALRALIPREPIGV